MGEKVCFLAAVLVLSSRAMGNVHHPVELLNQVVCMGN